MKPGKIDLYPGKTNLIGCTTCVAEVHKRVKRRDEEDRLWFAYAKSFRNGVRTDWSSDLRYAVESDELVHAGPG